MQTKYNNEKKKEKAILFLKNSSFSEAIELFEDIIKNDNSDSQTYYLLGTSYLQLRKLDLAELNLKNALKLNNNFISAIHNLGIAMSLKKNFLEAEKNFLKVLEFKPKNVDTLIELARNYELSNNLDYAKKYYEEVLKLDENNKQAKDLLGRMLINNGFHKLGLTYLRKSTGLVRFHEKSFEIIK